MKNSMAGVGIALTAGVVAVVAGSIVGAADAPSERGLHGAPAQFGSMEEQASVVFAPGTTPEEMVDDYARLLKTYGVLGLEHMIGGAGLELQPAGARWNSTRGTPVNLTYSFPSDGVSTGQGPNSINATLSSRIGANWKAVFAQALNNEWADVTAVTYTEVSDDDANWPNSPGSGTRGDIRIVAGPNGGSGGVLAFNFFPTTGDMFLDQDENWGSTANGFRFFRNVVTHENGHGMGLAHVCPGVGQTGGSSKIMEPFIITSFDGIQFDDVLAIQYQYGDPFEPNGSFGSAKSLENEGLQSGSNLVIQQLSLHALSDVDLYKFDAVAGSVINLARAAPVGFTFLNGPQLGNGSCSAGTSFDALRQFDLAIDVLTSTGSVIATSSVNGFGGFEELTGVALPSDGTYMIRVRAVSTGVGDFNIQAYSLTVNATLAAVVGDLNGDGSVNGIDLLTLLNSWGSPGAGGEDINGDGTVDGADLLILLNNWTG